MLRILCRPLPHGAGIDSSQLGRQLLTELCTQAGLTCAVADWSPRGAGAPRHPDLPQHWHACLSHSHYRVIAGLSPFPVGLDIEFHRTRRRPRLRGLIDALPEPRVRQAILDAAVPEDAFYRFWCAREALFKLRASPDTGLFEHDLDQALRGAEASIRYWQSQHWSLAIAVPPAHASTLKSQPTSLVGLDCVNP